MDGITAHSVVRNEALVYYSVKSVYSFVDKILLDDTGSDDAHTIGDINRLLDEDKDDKIVFRHTVLDVDETKWTHKNYHKIRNAAKGKGMGVTRLQQLQRTKTKFFMVLDGDEVHYEAHMWKVLQLVKHWVEGRICGFGHRRWHASFNTIVPGDVAGRIFLTDAIGMYTTSPGEIHTDKETGRHLTPGYHKCFHFAAPACAHFAPMLKPFRRLRGKVSPYKGPLPEVMVRDPEIMNRWLREHQS